MLLDASCKQWWALHEVAYVGTQERRCARESRGGGGGEAYTKREAHVKAYVKAQRRIRRKSMRVLENARACHATSHCIFRMSASYGSCACTSTHDAQVKYAYFHCAKAYMRSKLWQPDSWPDEVFEVRFGPYVVVGQCDL